MTQKRRSACLLIFTDIWSFCQSGNDNSYFTTTLMQGLHIESMGSLNLFITKFTLWEIYHHALQQIMHVITITTSLVANSNHWIQTHDVEAIHRISI